MYFSETYSNAMYLISYFGGSDLTYLIDISESESNMPTSSWKAFSGAIPQGSSLGPVSFLVLIGDFVYWIVVS